MKLRTATPISVSLDEIPTDDGKINLDDSTQLILKSFLMEYKVEPKNWKNIITAWYKNYPYVSVEDIDQRALMEFTIQFKIFLIGQVREIYDTEQKAFFEFHGKQWE
jgi:hypothetical protein